jgi:hypothetical protein
MWWPLPERADHLPDRADGDWCGCEGEAEPKVGGLGCKHDQAEQ